MALREVRLGPGECSDLDTGARFFSSMGYPGPEEDQARKRAEGAYVSGGLRELLRIDPTPFLDQRFNDLANADPGSGRAALRTSRRRLRDRMATARCVRPWLREWLGNPDRLPAGMRKFSQRQIALYVARAEEQAAADFLKRVLRPSRPVLHLAIAVDIYDLDNGCIRTDTGIALDDIDRIGRIVALSNVLKLHICSEKRYRVAERDLMHLTWVQ